MVPVYTDLFNEALDNLTATLEEITGLTVVNDPRNIQPPCIFINAPSFTTPAMNNTFVKMTFPVQVLTLGPFNLDAQRNLLHLASMVLAKNVAITDGRPMSIDIGGTLMPAYELTIEMAARA